MSRNYYDQDTDGISSLIEDVINSIKYDYEERIRELNYELTALRNERDDLVIQIDDLHIEVEDLKIWHARRNGND